jgi:hypothetical protein
VFAISRRPVETKGLSSCDAAGEPRHSAEPLVANDRQVTSNGTAWRLDCDPVARNPAGGAGAPTLWPTEHEVLASSTRFAGGGADSAEPWTESDAPAWIPHLLRVSTPSVCPPSPLGSGNRCCKVPSKGSVMPSRARTSTC